MALCSFVWLCMSCSAARLESRSGILCSVCFFRSFGGCLLRHSDYWRLGLSQSIECNQFAVLHVLRRLHLQHYWLPRGNKDDSQ